MSRDTNTQTSTFMGRRSDHILKQTLEDITCPFNSPTDRTGSGDLGSRCENDNCLADQDVSRLKSKCQTTLTGVAAVQIKENLDLNTVIPW